MKDENYYTDYAKGINDCLDGKEPEDDVSDRYEQGYGDQYELEQIISGEARN